MLRTRPIFEQVFTGVELRYGVMEVHLYYKHLREYQMKHHVMQEIALISFSGVRRTVRLGLDA